MPLRRSLVIVLFLVIALSASGPTAGPGDAPQAAQGAGPGQVLVLGLKDPERARGLYPLSRLLDVLPDREGRLTIEQVASPEFSGRFQPNRTWETGLDRKVAAYWVRFSLRTEAEGGEEWLFYQTWSYARVYEAREEGGFEEKRTGGFLPLGERCSRAKFKGRPLVPLRLRGGTEQVFYARLSSGGWDANLNRALWAQLLSRERVDKEETAWNMKGGFLVGVFFAIGLYHLVLSLSARYRPFFHWGAYCVCVAFAGMAFYGFAEEFLWPGHPKLVFFLLVGPYIPLSSFFVTRFLQLYLDLKVRLPWGHKAMTAFFAGMVLATLLLPFGLEALVFALCINIVWSAIALLVILALLFRKGSRPARVVLIACAVALPGIVIWILAVAGVLPYNSFTASVYPVGMVLTLVLFGLGLAERLNELRSDKERAEAEVRQKREELEKARQLQLSLLPKRLPRAPGLDLAVSMQTATEVGGDYYDFLAAEDGSLVAAVGDATGHGLEAGTLVVAAKSLFTDLARAHGPAGFLAEASKVLTEMRFPGMFMCMMAARLQGRRLALSGAAMPYALLWRSSTGRAEEVPTPGAPLASFPGYSYKEREVVLEKGDAVLLMTDGLAEVRNPGGELLGFDRVKDLFEGAAAGSAEQIVARLLAAAGDWSKGQPQADDVTLLAAKVLE